MFGIIEKVLPELTSLSIYEAALRIQTFPCLLFFILHLQASNFCLNHTVHTLVNSIITMEGLRELNKNIFIIGTEGSASILLIRSLTWIRCSGCWQGDNVQNALRNISFISYFSGG